MQGTASGKFRKRLEPLLGFCTVAVVFVLLLIDSWFSNRQESVGSVVKVEGRTVHWFQKALLISCEVDGLVLPKDASQFQIALKLAGGWICADKPARGCRKLRSPPVSSLTFTCCFYCLQTSHS